MFVLVSDGLNLYRYFGPSMGRRLYLEGLGGIRRFEHLLKIPVRRRGCPGAFTPMRDCGGAVPAANSQ